MRELARDEYAYKAERDHLPDETPCVCSSCAATWRYDQLAQIGDCSLTPGDASPAGRCGDPACDALVYPADAAAKMANQLESALVHIRDLRGALAGVTHEAEQMRGMFDDEDGNTETALADAAEIDARAGAFVEAVA